MSAVGQREILTQQRVVAFFRDTLGYTYLGHWKDREGNANVDEALLTNWMKRQGHGDKLIGKVLFELGKAAALGGSKTLYDGSRAVYGLLRYGVKVKPEVGEQTQTVWLVDWASPENNDFGVAEEVTVFGVNTKRPDVVLYVNGIALGVLELKRSTVSVSEGIRQNLDSQKKEFIRPYYTTVQVVMAGNDTEGLRYGVIETPEKYWLRWKETDAHHDAGDHALLRELGQLCGKVRLLEIVHDFMVFDAGIKKTCRHNQYFGVRAAQASVERREGGILWHTQGSGKSLIMVWLAKWIREHVADSRVLIHHRPHRAGRADREGLQRRQRGHLPHQERGRSGAGAEHERRVAALLADPQVRRLRGRRCRCLRRGHQAQPAEGLPRQGRALRLRGRVPPHPVGQAA
jgi:type I restriction enzyme, R subunit